MCLERENNVLLGKNLFVKWHYFTFYNVTGTQSVREITDGFIVNILLYSQIKPLVCKVQNSFLHKSGKYTRSTCLMHVFVLYISGTTLHWGRFPFN